MLVSYQQNLYLKLHVTLVRLYLSTLVLSSISPLHPYSSTPLYLYTSTPLCLYASTPLHLYTYTPLYLYASTPLRLYASTPLRLYASTPLHVYTSTLGLLHVLTYNNHIYYITVLKFTNAALVRLIIQLCKTISCTKEMFLGFIDILRFKIIIKGKKLKGQ